MALTRTKDLHQSTAVKGTELVGLVVDNEDPDKLNRLRIRIQHLHKGIPDSDLPWMTPAILATGAANAETMGQQPQIPVKGAKVYIRYEDDTLYHGKYYGTVQTKKARPTAFTEGKDNEDAKDYPHVSGDLDESGNKTIKNTKKDIIGFKHVSGTSYEIDGHGRVKIQVNDQKVGPDAKQKNNPGVQLEVIGKVDLVATDDVTVQTKGNIIIKTDQPKGMHIWVGEGEVGGNAGILIETTADIYLVAKGAIKMNKAPTIVPKIPVPEPSVTKPEVKAGTRPVVASPAGKEKE